MRTTLVAVVVGAAMLFVAGPAAAKGPAELYVSGGDLEDDIAITGRAAYRWPGGSGLMDPFKVAAPTDLGSRYDVLFITYAGQERETVQHLYPFAKGGPVVYTPARQRWASGPNGIAPEGWTRADPDLIRMLEAKGLPADPQAPPRRHRPSPDRAERCGRSP